MNKSRKPILGICALAAVSMGLILVMFGPDFVQAIDPAPPVVEQLADITVN